MAVIIILYLFSSCNNATKKSDVFDPEKFTVEPATEWTRLLERDSGWIAADGIFSLSLDGNDSGCDANTSIMLWYSDTFVGTLEDHVPDSSTVMVNNSMAFLEGCSPDPEKIEFFINKDSSGSPIAFFVPDNENARLGQYYWLGDGFVNVDKNNTLYIFAYHVEMTGPNVFDFIEPNVSILAIDPDDSPPFNQSRQLTTPLHIDHPEYGVGNFGAGVYVHTNWAGSSHPDGYVYIYACIGDDKDLLTARARSQNFEDFDTWQYWDGHDWADDPLLSKASTNAVSNELSVTQLPSGEYLLTFQVMGLSEKVGCRIGQSPVGPWSDIIDLYETPESSDGMFTYNAKAHPALSQKGELIISYNTITLDFWNDIKNDVRVYRPRFIKLKYNQ